MNYILSNPKLFPFQPRLCRPSNDNGAFRRVWGRPLPTGRRPETWHPPATSPLFQAEGTPPPPSGGPLPGAGQTLKPLMATPPQPHALHLGLEKAALWPKHWQGFSSHLLFSLDHDRFAFTSLIRAVTPTSLAPATPFSRSRLSHRGLD